VQICKQIAYQQQQKLSFLLFRPEKHPNGRIVQKVCLPKSQASLNKLAGVLQKYLMKQQE
jgi:hypothetical protein